MKKVSSVLLLAATIAFLPSAEAAVSCMGKVSQIYKWNYMTTVSIRVSMSGGAVTRWVNLPSKSDEAMAMMALAGDRDIEIYWNATDVSSCSAGWSDNRALEGYLRVFGS